jgi:serine/threonine protein kinase
MSERPAVIGRYQVERQLGEGGMGVLYLAADPVLERHVALKLLRVDSVDLRRRFVREAQSAARIQHPNIVTVYDVGDHEGQLYIAMEYIDGDTLASLIRDNVPFSPIRKLDIVDEIADGLGFAHQRGIIHRDIKPANLMITRSGLVKVLDFGIARVAHKQSGEIDGPTLVGTPAYMAPEQLEGAEADARSDIYAVGLVMYELFARRRAFSAPTTADVLQLVLEGRPTPLTKLVPHLDEELARIVDRAMARQPADRYPDLQALRKDLARARRRAMAANSDDATIVVGMPALAVPPQPAAPPTTRGDEPLSAPPAFAPPAPRAPGAPTAEDAVLARLAAERSGRVRVPVTPVDDDYEPTIVSPVPVFDPSWQTGSTGRPAPTSPPSSTTVPGPPPPAAPPALPVEPPVARTAPPSPPPPQVVVPPPMPVPLPSVPSGALPRQGGGVTADAPVVEHGESAPRRSSPPRAAVVPAAAPLAPPVPATPIPATPWAPPPAVEAVAPSPLPSVPAPLVGPPPASTAGRSGPPSGGTTSAGAHTTAPLPTARRGVPAAAIVGGLVALLGLFFIAAFLIVRGLGLFDGPSLLTRLLSRAESTVVKSDPPSTDPPVTTQEPPVTEPPVVEPPATTTIEPVAEPPAATEEPIQPPVTSSVEPPVATTSIAPPVRQTPPKSTPRPPRTGPGANSTRPTVPPVVVPPPVEERRPVEAPARDEPPPVREPPREVEAEAPREDALALVRGYVAARNTSHAGGIRRVWPSVDEVHLRRVTSSFSAPLTLVGCNVEARGRDRAIAVCQLTQPGTTGVFAQGQSLSIRRTFTFDLERQGRGWVIGTLRE